MTESSLRTKVVIVTGASRGLGRAMAVALAARGAIVVAAARSSGEATQSTGMIEETASMIRSQGGAAIAEIVDVRDRGQVAGLISRVLARLGRIDVLINNAGVMLGDIACVDTTLEDWHTIIDVNLHGAFLCAHAVIAPMLARGHGAIINITSGAAVRTGFLNLPYGVSKAGLDRLTLGLGAELKARGIACVSLSPPVSATDTVRAMYPERQVDDWAESPARTATALCLLLEDNPMQYTGTVIAVRDYLTRQGA